jgi:hypothetical protein
MSSSFQLATLRHRFPMGPISVTSTAQTFVSQVRSFCRAKLNQRMLSSTPPPTLEMIVSPACAPAHSYIFFHHLHPPVPAHTISYNSTNVKILQFYKCQNFTNLQVSKFYKFQASSTAEQMPALVSTKERTRHPPTPKFGNDFNHNSQQRRKARARKCSHIFKKQFFTILPTSIVN